MNYTNDKEQIVFLRDADIASSLNGKAISSDQPITTNGIPSFDLFKNKYEELSTYDNNICAYIKDGVEVSVLNLCSEIANLRNETDALSTNICVSVDYISGFVRNTISVDLYQLSSGTKETSTLLSNLIIALWEDVKGGVNYKGHLYGFEEKKIDGHNLALSDIFALKYNLMNTEEWSLSANKTFNNGWLYNVTLTGDCALTGYQTYEVPSISLENNDYIIIHNKDLSCVDVSCISRDTVDIIEAVQDDYVRFALLKLISDYLSSDYVNKIATLSDSLSNDVDTLRTNIYTHVNTLSSWLSTDIATLTTLLSNRIDDLSDSISGVVELSVKKLQDQVISNDNDIEFLSNNISVEVKRNLDSVHRKKDIVVNAEDHTIKATLKRTFGDVYDIRIGYMTRFPTAHTITNEAASWSYDFEVNDFILFKKNCNVDNADETCFDIIKDYDIDVSFLCAEIQKLSDDLSSDIDKLSANLSIDIDHLRESLSSTVKLSVENLQEQVIANDNDIEYLSNDLSTYEKNANLSIANICVEISANDNDIEYLSNDLSTYEKNANLSIANICVEIAANDNDIEYLSNNISVEVKRNLDSVHYKKDVIFNPDDNTIRATFERTFNNNLNAEIRVGYVLRFPSDHVLVNEDRTWTYNFETNDFIIFRENTTPNTATLNSFDIIKDYDEEIKRTYNNLSTLIFDVSTFISNDVSYLSGFVKNTISADLYKLSIEVSSVSTDICISANQISNALSALSVNLSTHLCALQLSVDGISTIVTTLSVNLSTDICANYNSLTTQINATSSYISGEVAKNDIDIANIQNYISGSNSLCTELSTVKYHWNKTFVETSYPTTVAENIPTDILKVVNSQNAEEKFVLVYLSGTLVLSSL